jgi:NRAMP (natural resistance-associated macrophage protein)-like metal ion transporter
MAPPNTAKAPAKASWVRLLFGRLGPGLITGAADDDPSGIATYSQAGAQFGLSMLWTIVITYPLMTAVQSISARIGRVTGKGLAANMLQVAPKPLIMLLVGALFVANTINIGADLAAMGAAAKLVTGWSEHVFTIGFAILSVVLQVLVPYHRYVKVLKWLTMALFTYIGVIFTVHIDWLDVGRHIVLPGLKLDGPALTLIVALFGTTISPYLFFWQSSEEVEDVQVEAAGPDHGGDLLDFPDQAPAHLRRIGIDTAVGMAFSNLVAFFIILTTAVTLHAHGVTDIQTSAQAAQALKPVAGPFAFLLFSLGLVGAGLLAVPVLAGSAGYAVGEIFGWRCGLEKKPHEAPAFYGVIAAAILLGLIVDYVGLDPIKALFWSAVINGVISAPIMVGMMVVAGRRKLMGRFTATPTQVVLGWLATAAMAATVVGMFALG